MRKIFGTVRDNGQHKRRIGTGESQSENIVKFIKRIRWLGNVCRNAKRIMEWKPEERKVKASLKKRCFHRDGCQRLETNCSGRTRWNRLIVQTKTRRGLRVYRRRRRRSNFN